MFQLLTKYDVGDKVRIVNYRYDKRDGDDPNGMIGIVKSQGLLYYDVYIEGNYCGKSWGNDTGYWPFDDEELEKVEG